MKRQTEVVVITGASAVVGRATVHHLVRHGARIALIARQSPALDAATAEARALGATVLATPVDVADARLPWKPLQVPPNKSWGESTSESMRQWRRSLRQ